MTITQFAEQSANISHTYQVTQEVYNGFQQCSSDYNPLHTDSAFASSKGFSSVVMYGNILNAFVSHFVGMLLPTREVMIQSQDICYQKPVFLNDKIILELKAVQSLHMAHEIQLVNYLTATGIDDGLLINFGSEELQFKRKFRIYRKRFQ